MTEEFPEVSKEELEQAAFRAKITEKAREKAGHFHDVEFDPKQLTREDRLFWEKIEDRSITLEEAGEILTILKDPNLLPSRRAFLAFINNLATGVIGKRQMAEERRNRNKGPQP